MSAQAKNMQGIAKRNAERKKEFNECRAKRNASLEKRMAEYIQNTTSQENSMKTENSIFTRAANKIKKVYDRVFGDFSRFHRFVIGTIIVFILIALMNGC